MPYFIVDPLTKLQESDCNDGVKSSLLSLHASTHVHRPDALSGRLTKGATNAAGTTPNIIAVSTATCASAFAAPVAV